jgi:FtsH-binding integral membrane protein
MYAVVKKSLKAILLGFGAVTIVLSFFERLRTPHFWLGVACVITWLAWTLIDSITVKEKR